MTIIYDCRYSDRVSSIRRVARLIRGCKGVGMGSLIIEGNEGG
jgi:hypothetical protein